MLAKLTTSIRDLDVGHYNTFTTALTNLLRTDVAEHTFAEIIDGIPTARTWSASIGLRHDIIEAHHDLCPGTLDAARQYRENLRPENLELDPAVLTAYGGSTVGSRPFKLRLIELLAIVFHDLAVLLHQEHDGGLHKGAHTWQRAKPSYPRRPTHPPPLQRKPLPTVFFHGSYCAWEQYPTGVADMVGYWAEARLFGGVVLFDRREDKTGCHDVYMHPSGARRLIFQPSEEQLDHSCAFLQTPIREEDETISPLPLTPEKRARRVDPWDAFESLNIFRNRYERKLPEIRPTNRHVALVDQPDAEDLFREAKRFLR